MILRHCAGTASGISLGVHAVSRSHFWRNRIPVITHYGIALTTLLFVSSLTSARQNNNHMTNSGSWSGIIMNSGCTLDEAFAEAAKCTERVPGTKLVLYDDTTRQFFDLDTQAEAGKRLGDSVTVLGILHDNAIQVGSIEPLAPIGLGVAEKAPSFSAPDQFGHEQNLQTLKGSHGTILLFFRSADW